MLPPPGIDQHHWCTWLSQGSGVQLRAGLEHRRGQRMPASGDFAQKYEKAEEHLEAEIARLQQKLHLVR